VSILGFWQKREENTMVSIRTLEIAGYQQTPVPHRFFQPHAEASTQLALLLAGGGYSSEGPVLHYPLLALLERRMDVLVLDYPRRQAIKHWPLEQAQACALTDTTAAYQAIIDQHPYQGLTLLGKSLGTLVMGELLASHTLSTPVQQAIWLTPVLSSATLREQIHQTSVPSLLVIGTDDSFYHPDWLAEAQPQSGAEVLVIPQADHRLDRGLDALRSLRAIERMIEAVCAFLDHRELP
jgi:predicted alpha/beta-hydrolase family hydrolase